MVGLTIITPLLLDTSTFPLTPYVETAMTGLRAFLSFQTQQRIPSELR